MKCPNCGFEMKEGQLYCEGCGREIQIVPEFEPEIENSIRATLSSVATEIAPQIEEKQRDVGKRPAFFLRAVRHWKRMRRKKRAVFLIAFLCFVGIFLAGFFLVKENSPSYQYEQAVRLAEQGNDVLALDRFRKAAALDPNNLTYLNALAYSCYTLGEYETAEKACLQIIGLDSANEKAYRCLIQVYEQQSRFDKINELLLSCQETAIVNKYLDYLAKPPEFGLAPGIYHEKISLKLIANTNGSIYYTINGENPKDTEAEEYLAPLELENGTYTIRAYFVNSYGISSEEAVGEFYIDMTVPETPEVLPAGGAYDAPQQITVSVPEDCRVFYTTDGTAPTMDSIEYTAPVYMPLGTSVFRFITYSKAGAASEECTVRYSLNLHAALNTEAARNKLLIELKSAGAIENVAGDLKNSSGHLTYQFRFAFRLDQKDYYLFREYYEDAAELRNATGTEYAVDVMEGFCYRAIPGETEGSYILSDLTEETQPAGQKGE